MAKLKTTTLLGNVRVAVLPLFYNTYKDEESWKLTSDVAAIHPVVLSVFSPNKRKHRPEKLWTQQTDFHANPSTFKLSFLNSLIVSQNF